MSVQRSTVVSKGDLESAVMEAKIFTEIIAQWAATSLGFEKSEPPSLTKEDCTHLYWAFNTAAQLTKEADQTFIEWSKASRGAQG